LPPWLHCAIGLALLAAAAILDITKPFDKSWSIFYLIPILYAGSNLTGPLESLLHVTVGLTVFLVPLVFQPDLLWLGTGIYNRGFGVVLGFVLVFLMRERRGLVHALESSNDDLERRVQARTTELEAANHLLRLEIAQREKSEADQRRLEEQLRQAQKMEAIGLLAGGVAHDFNNLLTVVIGQCSLLREDLPTESPWRGSLAQIQAAGERAAKVTQQLLAFGRKQMLQPETVNVNQVIDGVENVLHGLLPDNIRLIIDRDPAVRSILADRGQFTQLLLNLASNARDAMPEGGELRIKTEPVVVTGKEVASCLDLHPGPHVRLTVSDTGQGMDEVTRQHAFDPFFTTKQFGKGSGLGLASVYGIVKQSHGHIDLASTPGVGTTFTILWPSEACPVEQRAGEQ
jgi:signal transduction histidine kinase